MKEESKLEKLFKQQRDIESQQNSMQADLKDFILGLVKECVFNDYRISFDECTLSDQWSVLTYGDRFCVVYGFGKLDFELLMQLNRRFWKEGFYLSDVSNLNESDEYEGLCLYFKSKEIKESKEIKGGKDERR